MKNALIVALLLATLPSAFAAQKVYPVQNPVLQLQENRLVAEGKIKLSVFRTVQKKSTKVSVSILSKNLNCLQSYECSARNFAISNNILYADIFIDLDMDGNIDQIIQGKAIAKINDSDIDLSNVKLIYVDANRTILEDRGPENFFSATFQLP